MNAQDPEHYSFIDAAQRALGDPAAVAQRDMLARVTPQLRERAVAGFGEFEALRQHLRRVRQHTLDNLDYYLPRFELEATHNGNRVHYAETARDLNGIVLDICREHGARRVAKGKSMVTEETELTASLEREGLHVVETDLGEYIVQLAGEKPAHIVGPARHKSIAQIRELFLAAHKLGERKLERAEDLVAEARQVMREHFLGAEVGIIGANALIAENGYSMLVTNEGNGDLCASLPKVLIVCTTLDRLLPRATDAAALQRLLVRSATGQDQTCYTSFYSGPRRAADADGPLETHIVLLDNHRSDILDSDYRDMLQCIRCGACLNHCPIFAAAGGHAYGSVYPGPMGSVLAPLLDSLETYAELPNACTSCGRCEEVCPAAIPLPDLLRDLRHDQQRAGITPQRWRRGMRLHAWLAGQPRLYHWLTARGIGLLNWLGRRRGAFRRLPFAGGWTGERDFPAPQRGTFMQQYRALQREVPDDE
ncbi:iron-sulfur cluster-binding protein [Mangrovimicrobium sediminis]|uniref:Iron-sulfur cluster-binding protein n=1 Tax=Mangrovimicrobium sediminis TaxID=2562682 RepID=A0A4Z0M239_9GAMM|nr:LutB/LldF family L-lactate oxidation iron-sulfur protein [Haliea sp. SAOS-164]TGD73438.1 iron-sulfur cluster-binding protein [Haliea sp. SAOS-164]